ncbi:hypothetical protein OG203_36885 [Nocardia sp. NBC_01499]|uniref:hypothetical protein n=1 Tax=Nocardia sp. NBC_01499 TaxID=2903597 RepID=UPI003864BFA1
MSVRPINLFVLAAAFVLPGTTVAVAAPATSATFICKEMSFKGPQSLGLYCNATNSAQPTGQLKTAFTIALDGEGPIFACTNGTATKKASTLEVSGRCYGLPLGTKADGTPSDTASGAHTPAAPQGTCEEDDSDC